MSEQAHPPTDGADRRRTLDPGPPGRRPLQVVFSMIITACFLGLVNVMVGAAFFVVTGLWTTEIPGIIGSPTQGQMLAAGEAIVTGPGGAGVLGLRLLVALLICLGPLTVGAFIIANRHLMPWGAAERYRPGSLLLKWAGVVVAVLIMGAVADVTGSP